ncbi:MAG: hypothetical protein JW946_02295, partial [Candidatus Omnitrophica bacterium]|nr:hypothetical protein [Candidatus Omnitrophota bacterium]
MNPKEKLLSERSLFNRSSLIYKAICWALIISFSWQQLAQAADFTVLLKPANNILPLDKAEALVKEGADLSSISQQEEKYIERRGFSAIDKLNQMRQERESLRRKNLVEQKRGYLTYMAERAQEHTLLVAQYDSYRVYQDVTRIMAYAREETYKAGISWRPGDNGEYILFQRGVVIAVLNEKITLSDGGVIYRDMFNMTYDERNLLSSYTTITHYGKTPFDPHNIESGLYDFKGWVDAMRGSFVGYDPNRLVEQFGAITEQMFWDLKYSDDSVFYASSDPDNPTNAIKHLLSYRTSTRTYGSIEDGGVDDQGYLHVFDYGAGNSNFTEYIYDESGNLVTTIEYTDCIYDLRTGSMISCYRRVDSLVNDDEDEEGYVFFELGSELESAFSISIIQSSIITDLDGRITEFIAEYRDASGNLIFSIKRYNIVYENGDIASFDEEKTDASSGAVVYDRHFTVTLVEVLAGGIRFVAHSDDEEETVYTISEIIDSYENMQTSSYQYEYVATDGTIYRYYREYENGDLVKYISTITKTNNEVIETITDYAYEGTGADRHLASSTSVMTVYETSGTINRRQISITYDNEGRITNYNIIYTENDVLQSEETNIYTYVQDGNNTIRDSIKHISYFDEAGNLDTAREKWTIERAVSDARKRIVARTTLSIDNDEITETIEAMEYNDVSSYLVKKSIKITNSYTNSYVGTLFTLDDITSYLATQTATETTLRQVNKEYDRDKCVFVETITVDNDGKIIQAIETKEYEPEDPNDPTGALSYRIKKSASITNVYNNYQLEQGTEQIGIIAYIRINKDIIAANKTLDHTLDSGLADETTLSLSEKQYNSYGRCTYSKTTNVADDG